MGSNSYQECKQVLSRYGCEGWQANLESEFQKRGIRDTNQFNEPLSDAQRLVQMFEYEMVGACRRFSPKDVLNVVRQRAESLQSEFHAYDGGFRLDGLRLPRSPCHGSCSSDSTESVQEESDEDDSDSGHKRIKKRHDPNWTKRHPQQKPGSEWVGEESNEDNSDTVRTIVKDWDDPDGTELHPQEPGSEWSE